MDSSHRTEQFLVLYSAIESRLFAYLMALLGHRADAEEVMQETALALWRSFDKFTPGTSFLNWAKRIAFHRVLQFRSKAHRIGMPGDEEFLRAVDRALAKRSDELDARLRALNDCVGKLREPDRELLMARYMRNRRVTELAVELDRPVNTLYKALERIRHALVGCITRALSREANA